MEYSVGSVGSGYSQVKPLSYGLSNQSVTSSSFAESIDRASGSDGVGLVAPTRYPNARLVSPLDKAAESIKVSKAYNDVAEGLTGVANGYNNRSQRSNYSTTGSTLDVYV